MESFKLKDNSSVCVHVANCCVAKNAVHVYTYIQPVLAFDSVNDKAVKVHVLLHALYCLTINSS